MPAAAAGVAIGVGGAAVLLAALDAYVVVTVLIDIATDLGIAVNHLERATPMVTGYLLGYVAGMPLLGGLSDRLGPAGGHPGLPGRLRGRLGWSPPVATDLPHAGRRAGALQGLAGGALLPVTMALVGDLWERAAPTGRSSAPSAPPRSSAACSARSTAPALAALIGWRGIFWVNIPLALLAMVAVQLRPAPHGRDADDPAPKVDVVGGLLLAVALGLLVVGLYNPDPEASVLPPWGPATAAAGGGVFLLFLLWETFARTKLIDLTGVPQGAVLRHAGGQPDRRRGADGHAGRRPAASPRPCSPGTRPAGRCILTRFLIALPVGALLGGVLAPRLGERWVTAGRLRCWPPWRTG